MSKYFNLLDNIANAAKAEKAAPKSKREYARTKRMLAESNWKRAVALLDADTISRIASEWEKRCV